MPWPWIFIGIAVGGLVMLVCFGVWLAHKASDLFAELRVLAQRAGQGAELLSRIEIPDGRSSGELIYPDHDPDVVVRHRVPTT
ncbi:hypothetical protein [Microlunatus parietis]|uniref:Uncharacterized protein n=1 Tax=Microlunatus parietis TaxID=682979 RepID=A0A7Y9I3P1_9ACTN|nr:hypothetical protein [Microlunatus parietis]NYE69582.1 hypothetical protein [Microlunatus parietis]